MFLKFQNITINTKTIGFIKCQNGKYYCQYRRKASVKEVEIPISFGNLNDSQYFAKIGFYKLENYFINPSSLSFINTEKIPNSNDVKIHLSFINGLELNFKMNGGRFTVWVDNRLRNNL